VSAVALRSLLQMLARGYSSVVRRAPTSSAMLAKLSEMVARDDRRESILRCLEIVLEHSLVRRIVVVPAEESHGEVERDVLVDTAWRIKRADIAARLGMWPKSESASLRLMRVFGQDALTTAKRIAMLVPILSPGGARVALLVIGKRRVRPLTDSECTLVAAAVGMTTLLLEQVRLRDMLHVAEAMGETAERLRGSHQRRHMFSNN
jgi:hypothetical protein